MNPKGGKRKDAGRKRRIEPKSNPIWCGQISKKDRNFIIVNLRPQERFIALMEAAKQKRERT